MLGDQGKETTAVVDRVRTRLAYYLAGYISRLTSTADRLSAAAWLTVVREIIADPALSNWEKTRRITATIDLQQTTRTAGNAAIIALKSYRDADMPLAVKVAAPVTLLAVPFVGGAGAGIAIMGGAIGVPALLLVFLGTAGITSVIETIIGSREGRNYVGVILALIAQDEVLRRTRQTLREAMTDRPTQPHHFDMPTDQAALHAKLLAMDPFEFEQHVMSFFQQQGWLAWVTPRSNDAGVDGFARHPEGLILVQCKRNALGNPIGRPVVQQFKGVVEENQAWRGYIVTTSRFTDQAFESAALSDKLRLIDADHLLAWHHSGARFD